MFVKPRGPAAGTGQVYLHRRCFSPVLQDLSVQRDFPSLPCPMAQGAIQTHPCTWLGLFWVLTQARLVGIHGTSMGMQRFLPPPIGPGAHVQRQSIPCSGVSSAASKQPTATGSSCRGWAGDSPKPSQKIQPGGKKRQNPQS